MGQDLGMAWLGPLLMVPQNSITVPAGLLSRLDLGIFFQAHLQCWQNSFAYRVVVGLIQPRAALMPCRLLGIPCCVVALQALSRHVRLLLQGRQDTV